MPTQIPENNGALDLDYLAAALSRAGRAAPSQPIEIEQLLGGRTGATVQRLASGAQSFVVKFVKERSWRVLGMGLEQGGEHRLWAAGVTRQLEGPISCPVIDVSYDPGGERFWLLMEDVGAGIRDRGKFTRADSRALFAALAEMQAASEGSPILDGAPLPPVSGPTRLFRAPVLHLSGKRQGEEEWLATMLDDFKVVGAFLPLFLETLGPTLADRYLELLDDDGWVAQLDAAPQTLLQGDLRRANIAFVGDGIPIFDWEFAAKGPAGCDLQWHCFLHYWGYPPDGEEAGSDCDDLAGHYVQHLERALGRAVDRDAFDRGWKLGWLKVMAQLGYTLVDSLYPDGGDAETRRRARRLCERAVQRALEMRAAL